MESKTFFVTLSMFLSSFLISSSQAYDFYVGGRDGWVLKPSESYDHWARRLRFQVNDTLVFKYNRGSDSVLVVSKQNFDTCSNKNPVLRLDDGESRYKLGNSGPFYFITGNQTNCQNGQKLILIVLAPRTKKAPVPPSAPATPPSTAPATPPSTAPATPPATAPATPPSTAPATPPTSAPATPPSTAPYSPPNSSPPAPATPPSSNTPVSAPPPVEASPPSGGTPSDGTTAPGGDSGQSPPPPKPSSSTILTASMGFTLACSLLITMARVGDF